MVYRAIGITGGHYSSGLAIAFTEFQEQGGSWTFQVLQTGTFVFSPAWTYRLENAAVLPAPAFQQLHLDFGQYVGQQVNSFIEQNELQYKVSLIAFQGFTVFSEIRETRLGDGASVAAVTGLPVIADFYAIDRVLGGSGSGDLRLREKLAVSPEATTAPAEVLTALMGILRWRQEYNVFATDTGASRDSIGGAIWTGQEA